MVKTVKMMLTINDPLTSTNIHSMLLKTINYIVNHRWLVHPPPKKCFFGLKKPPRIRGKQPNSTSNGLTRRFYRQRRCQSSPDTGKILSKRGSKSQKHRTCYDILDILTNPWSGFLDDKVRKPTRSYLFRVVVSMNMWYMYKHDWMTFKGKCVGP